MAFVAVQFIFRCLPRLCQPMGRNMVTRIQTKLNEAINTFTFFANVF